MTFTLRESATSRRRCVTSCEQQTNTIERYAKPKNVKKLMVVITN